METINDINPIISLHEIPDKIYNKTLSIDDRIRLSRGEYTSLLKNVQLPNGEVKDLKFCLRKNKTENYTLNFQLKRIELSIDDQILDYKITPDDKKELMSGRQVGPLKIGKTEAFLGIDPELNKIILRTRHAIVASKPEETDKSKNHLLHEIPSVKENKLIRLSERDRDAILIMEQYPYARNLYEMVKNGYKPTEALVEYLKTNNTYDVKKKITIATIIGIDEKIIMTIPENRSHTHQYDTEPGKDKTAELSNTHKKIAEAIDKTGNRLLSHGL